ncbi:MAG: DUF433 domain-containing protein [Planctomycetia bacterium]|nr:DUF433 domain-containing protein [Planctomycetia bacterium]
MSQLTGRFVVADPQICHGEPTFRGTRILVRDVLEQVAMGLEWDTICQQWRHAITNDAIAEAVRLGGEALRNHPEELVTELAGK